MAVAIPHSQRTAARPLAGLTKAVAPLTETTVLTMHTAAGDHADVELPSRPDARAAQRVRTGHRRLMWQRIDVAGERVECRVRGVRHRLPTDTAIGLGAALALATDGLPTVVHVHGAGVHVAPGHGPITSDGAA